MDDYNITSRSNELQLKREFIKKSLIDIVKDNNEEISDTQLEKEVDRALSKVKKKPLYQNKKIERHEIPFKEDFEADMKSIIEDISILSDENLTHGNFLKKSFNAVHSEKKRIQQRIDQLNSLTGDLFLITDEENDNIYYISESFNDSRAMDMDFSIDNISKGSIQTEEGILTLERVGSKNLSSEAVVSHLSGNGSPGTDHIVRKYTTVDEQGQPQEEYRFLNEGNEKQNTRVENILDDEADTLFEYQTVNVPEEYKKERRYYDFDWAKGDQENDKLRLKLVIEFEKEEDLNWITLHPYYPNNAIQKIIVHSIRTSTNGFDYEPLYDEVVLNEEINITPQTYRKDDIFTGETEAGSGFYQGKGVWSFPERKARFVEFVIDQNESYTEVIGNPVYYIEKEGDSKPIIIPEPEELKDSRPGKYSRYMNRDSITYVKEMQGTRKGWRYSIGIRDINLFQFQFGENSEFISKRYELPRKIEKLNLYTKEIIPESYLAIVNKNNDWIKYEVSFDDINWHRISPMHQEPLSDSFPPKIIELNTSMVDLENVFQIHKKVIDEEEAKHLRFRVSMTRPTGEVFESTTPILEEVAFKVELEDEL